MGSPAVVEILVIAHAERWHGTTAIEPRGLIVRYHTTIFTLLQSPIHNDMSFRKTLSSVKKDIRERFKKTKRNQAGENLGTSAGRTDQEESLSQSGSPFVGVGDRDPGGSGSNPVRGLIGSTDRPAQRDGSDPAPPGESKPDRGVRGEGKIDENEASQTQPSHPHSGVEAVIGSRSSGVVEHVPSDTPIPESAKPSGM